MARHIWRQRGQQKLGNQTDMRLGRIMRDDRRGEVHSTVPSWVRGVQSGGNRRVRIRSTHGPYPENKRERGRKREIEREDSQVHALYTLLGRSHAHVGGPRRWRCVRGGVGGRTPSRSPLLWWGTTRVECVYTGQTAGRSPIRHMPSTNMPREVYRRSLENCAGRSIDRSIDRRGSYCASRQRKR